MTLIQVGLENKVEGRTLAWALDYPGVFTYGSDDAEALLRMPREMLRFENWLNLHTDQPWVQLEGLDMHIDETRGLIGLVRRQNAWSAFIFQSDMVPLTGEDVRESSAIFNCSARSCWREGNIARAGPQA